MKKNKGTAGAVGAGAGQGPAGGQQGKQPGGQAPKPLLFSRASIIALSIVVLIYAVLFFMDPEGYSRTIAGAGDIFLQVIPVLAVVVLFMAGTNMIPNSFVRKHLGGESGFRGFLVAVLAGTLSHGPAYAWYPFLAELGRKGVSRGRIAAFLYARAVKIPLLAAMVLYFGLNFTVVFTVLIMLGALLIGLLFERMSFGEFAEKGRSGGKERPKGDSDVTSVTRE